MIKEKIDLKRKTILVTGSAGFIGFYLSKRLLEEIDDIKVKIGKTNPPSYLNEGTLLTAMEKNNLGTVATRADIIEKL